MKKTLFLGAILGAALCSTAFAAVTVTSNAKTYTAADLTLTEDLVISGVTVYDYDASTGIGVFTGGINFDAINLTISDTALQATTSNSVMYYASFTNASGVTGNWGLIAQNGGNFTGYWNGSAWSNAANRVTTHETIASHVSEGSFGLSHNLHNTNVATFSDDSSSAFNVTGLKSTGDPQKFTINTNYVTAVSSFSYTDNNAADVTYTVSLGEEAGTKEYNSLAQNRISDTAVEATVLGGGTSNARTEAKGASATALANNGGDIIIASKGQLYFTGGTLTNDIYIGGSGSDIYTEISATYTYSGDLRMQGDSGVELAGNLILTDNATIVGDGNGIISGEVQGAGKDLTINVGASGINKTMTFSGGGELNDLTVGNANHHIGIKFADNDFTLNSITTGGAIIVDGATLAIAEDATINTLTLNAGSAITVNNHDGSLTTSALTINGDAAINADLVTAANSTITFTEGSVTLGCSIDFGTGTTIALGEAYVEDLTANGQVLLFSGVDGLDLENLKNVAVTIGGVNGILLAEVQGDGSYNIYASPEPATTTLSLLALAGLMARRKRH